MTCHLFVWNWILKSVSIDNKKINGLPNNISLCKLPHNPLIEFAMNRFRNGFATHYYWLDVFKYRWGGFLCIRVLFVPLYNILLYHWPVHTTKIIRHMNVNKTVSKLMVGLYHWYIILGTATVLFLVLQTVVLNYICIVGITSNVHWYFKSVYRVRQLL